MKKIFFSILGGLLLGLVTSFILFNYQSSSISYVNRAGVDQVAGEMDFDFVFNASLMVIGISILIFTIWSFVDRKTDEKFLKDYESSRKENS
ncbi:hypothetical protein [Planococcus halotolerans]|uniref:Uncharacterized protein n=1 Tax=Planococcus halotolerans TaxID=2233542 RepID=A0A365KY98_9BACL|nr:hypothetical protein [Planococcus halotolerans]QHJ72216.1 hypothetical protein DNR44_017110 [Planococcus halotolerans]RAZ77767.1 hypothetical protein DP120_09825 [Planococcus halotolerans]